MFTHILFLSSFTCSHFNIVNKKLDCFSVGFCTIIVFLLFLLQSSCLIIPRQKGQRAGTILGLQIDYLVKTFQDPVFHLQEEVWRLRPCSRAFFYKFCEFNVYPAKTCYGGYFSTFPDCILLYLLVYGEYHIRMMMVVGTVHPNIRFWQVLVVRDLCDTFSVILSLNGC